VPKRSDEGLADVCPAGLTPATPPEASTAPGPTPPVATPTILFVPIGEDSVGLAAGDDAGTEVAPATRALLEERVRAWLVGDGGPVGDESVAVGDVRWHLAMAETLTTSGERSGALALARSGPEGVGRSVNEISTVQAFARLYESRIEAEVCGPLSPASPWS